MTERLPKVERLRGKIRFAELANSGESLRASFMRLKWLVRQDQELPVTVGFSVPKRIVKKAVDRNRIKRQMRACYRAQKAQLYEALGQRGLRVSLLFIYQGPEKVTSGSMNHVMNRLISRWIKENAEVDG